MTVPAHLKIAVGVVEAADLLDLSEASVRRLIAAGHLLRSAHGRTAVTAGSAAGLTARR